MHVEVDHIGDMEIHVGNLVRGNGILGTYMRKILLDTSLSVVRTAPGMYYFIILPTVK